MKPTTPKTKKPNIFKILKPYRGLVILLILFALLSNGLNLWIPKIIGDGIDSFSNNTFSANTIIKTFGWVAGVIFVFTYLQSVLQTFTSEKVARDLRNQLSDKISRQSHAFVQKANPSKLLTNFTSDIDAIKLFVSQAVVSMFSSVFVIIGGSILLLSIDWKLALTVIAIIPVIGVAFFLVLKKVKVLYTESRSVIDRLNKTINESIIGAALIRVVNSQQQEYHKFMEVNARARDLGLSILRLFAALIPIIIFVANMANLVILVLGGHYVIEGDMTLGDFAAFRSYLALLIFPILVIGFTSNIIAQATASYIRIKEVLDAEDTEYKGSKTSPLTGRITVSNLNLTYDQKPILKNVGFTIQPAERVAIIGPTAAGKTQLLNILTGLLSQNSGTVLYDGDTIETYKSTKFYMQIGLVFQDSVLFNMTIRENIAFSNTVKDTDLQKAIDTAELADFIKELPDGLDTNIAERGTTLSGGQKQRIMLARALAQNPKILFLDDFTARVDTQTEQRIWHNLRVNYPEITLVSVTQKINAVLDYDRIILLMEGELLATGTHEELLHSSPEYVQIFNSQQSTSTYEL
ncbi:ABC transporter ATP-binding protein [Neptunitalea chrysea]|uniref:ABC transporter ATP-binding protein n=1 Tax=Neptunitalea chrysea TaxID=1647581 RepID=A0A9W6ETH6_9FLAO|nr:ABC transporter ATP-binding protein [Neptunitalea chrysea]GLB51064.1 ABC transporter ATP-binding protein [Neptunitalea chrysea]